MTASDENVLPVEVFLSAAGICLSVPKGCGLDQADSLRVNAANRTMVALKAGSELPIDLPMLSEAHCQALIVARQVPLAEFVNQGVVAAYDLTVIDERGQ